MKWLLFAMEVLAGILALIAGVLYAVGGDYGACLGNEVSFIYFFISLSFALSIPVSVSSPRPILPLSSLSNYHGYLF